jgi:hypothetical protein
MPRILRERAFLARLHDPREDAAQARGAIKAYNFWVVMPKTRRRSGARGRDPGVASVGRCQIFVDLPHGRSDHGAIDIAT